MVRTSLCNGYSVFHPEAILKPSITVQAAKLKEAANFRHSATGETDRKPEAAASPFFGGGNMC